MPGFSTIKHSYVWHEFVVRFLSVMWKISENNDQIQCQKHEASSKKFYFLQILNGILSQLCAGYFANDFQRDQEGKASN